MPGPINSALTLPSGLTLPNRLVKAAMTEGLADARNRATSKHAVLYGRWSDGGVGLQITGNVQVDRRHLERPGNIVIDGRPSNEEMAGLKAMAGAAQRGGGKIMMQLSHAGRQTPKAVNDRPAAPSPIALNMPGGVFGSPRAMTGEEVRGVVAAFGNAAKVARDCGFDGVQIHAAHGYLISQFLSPLANRREDEWGGPLENRARLLLSVIDEVRRTCGADFCVAVKLNSTDFQKGGFSHEDCLSVIDMLNAKNVDFVEISGGNYEQPKMAGIEGAEPVFEEPVRESTRAREAYFTNYARSVQARATMPIMVTGGFRSAEAMNAALNDAEADLIGLARPLCADPDLPGQLLNGAQTQADDWENRLRLGPGRLLGPHSPISLIKGLNGWGMQGWFCLQIIRMGDGLSPDTSIGLFSAFRKYQAGEAKAARAYQSALAKS